MDAALALTFLVGGVVTFITLFFTVWFGSLALLFRPEWIAERVVRRFWPERVANPGTLRRYRWTGCAGLCLAIFVSWEVVNGLFPG